jgi:pyrophosphatase PpaX
MPRFSTVLFDLDGTLIDSIALIVDSFRHTLAVNGLPPVSDDSIRGGIGMPLLAQLRGWTTDPATLERLVVSYRQYNLTHHDERVQAYPGAVEAVQALAARDIRVGVVTSKNRPGARRGLSLVALEGVIEVLVCSEDVIHGKPHPEPVQRAMTLLGAEPATTLFVGDSIHDMHAGAAALVSTGAALWGPFRRADLAPSGPNFWLQTPADVVDLVLGE